MLVSDGVNRQRLTGDGGFGFNNATAMAGANLISDTTVANVRTSVFNVPGFAGLRATLTQAATKDGLTRQHSFSNPGLATINLAVISFHDVDLDGGTFLNNLIAASGNTLSASEGARLVSFTPDWPGASPGSWLATCREAVSPRRWTPSATRTTGFRGQI